jgi:hypothetical protein
MTNMNLLSTAKRIQVIAALPVEQINIDVPEGEKEEVRNT